MNDLYDTDFVRWTEAQAALLRRIAEGQPPNETPDWENIIEEIETLGRSERSRLASHIGTVLEHLMTLEASPAAHPRAGWRTAITRARIGIAKVLKENPRLKPSVPAVITNELPAARTLVGVALEEYGETPRVPVDQRSYTEEQVLGPWLP